MSNRRAIGLILAGRGSRGFADGAISLLLPLYLVAHGFDPFLIGVLITATLAGSSAMTLLVGLFAHRYPARLLLIAGSWMMAATGLGFGVLDGFWPLLIVAALGTLNPSAGDVTLFLPIEQAQLARAVEPVERTATFARYSFVGSIAGAAGALAAGGPEIVAARFGVEQQEVIRGAFFVYALVGLLILSLYRRLPPIVVQAEPAPTPLRESRRIVLVLAALFSLDSFGGGFVVQSLLALWLFQRFDLSLTTTAWIFFWSGLFSAVSYFVAVRIARRIGLVNTMVFTHLPSSVCLILLPFAPSVGVAIALLLIRSFLSQMDVPTRTSYVMAVVTPQERSAAASVTAVPRSLVASVSPMLAGMMLSASAFGWPLIVGGALKIAYDLLLLAMFRAVKPPEERSS